MKNILYSLPIILSVGCTTTDTNVKLESKTPVYYQAYDESWYSDPSINPIFDEEWKAKDYVHRNMMNEIQSGHNYVVRVINHRYEVRQVNDVDDNILHTTNEFNDAYEYVVEYSSAHSDLIIFDLMTGKAYEETP